MNIEAYYAAHEQAAYLDRSSAGCVELTGRDRLALVHRLSTNAVEKLQPGAGALTVLTNSNGRIIDLVLLLAVDDDTALLITSPGRGAEIAAYISRNIFFNDQIKVRDLSEPTSQLHLYGPQSAAILGRLSGADLADLAQWHHRSVVLAGCPVRLARIDAINGGGWLMLADMAAVEALGEELDKAGATLLDEPTFASLRVEAGLPGLPELNLEYIPLEANLWDAVSFNKGCYVGQEIIARMESRGRLAKKLMGLRLSGPVRPPAKLSLAGKDAGIITTVVMSPRNGPVIGLGFVRTAHLEPGTVLEAADDEVSAIVTELPFA